jgi:predicted ATPase/transcriptional regulator with XRE-family HTH domain
VMETARDGGPRSLREDAEGPITFGTLLRQYRVAAGLTQEALSDRAGLAVRGIQNLERGRHRPQRETTARLIRALQLSGDARARFEAAASPAPRSVSRPPPIRLVTIGQDLSHTVHRGSVLTESEAAVPGTETSDRRRSTVPIPVTGLIGREVDLAEVRTLLGSNRLLTLTGTGGCGKTRLALELARAAADDFPDGAALVELDAISDPDLVAPTVALNVGLRSAAEPSPTESLVHYYADRHSLLVLDNCEHLIGACTELVNLLVRRCPKLSILATSREPLGVTGEVAWRVPSLRAMNPDDLPRSASDAVAAASSYAATQLFVERAGAVSPSFTIDAENVEPVVQICWRLDGIPLALELAAALASALSPAQISQRLDDRFSLLTVGSRAALPRQRTLLATLDWSHSLLAVAERTVFRRLAIFAGGFSLEAAERVCAADPLRQGEVLACLVRLVEKSLVVAQPRHGEIR